MHHDVIIIGAGPAGLCLAKALCDLDLKVALVERQARAAIAEPAFDGREIALTHASIRQLRDLGIALTSAQAAEALTRHLIRLLEKSLETP